MLRLPGSSRWRVVVAVSAAAVFAGLVWTVWPSRPAVPEPRARQYLDYRACLLTDGQGVIGGAAAVWGGLQDASAATRAKVQYLAVAGAQTAANALPYLASLAQSGCDLVLAVGLAPVAAVDEGAARFPGTRFVAVGGGSARPNVSIVDVPAARVRAEVGGVVTAAVRSASGRPRAR
jgi:basic membrane lipoprotein Med (substrate-binding protein (PBP1-ABC) superfamily)